MFVNIVLIVDIVSTLHMQYRNNLLTYKANQMGFNLEGCRHYKLLGLSQRRDRTNI